MVFLLSLIACVYLSYFILFTALNSLLFVIPLMWRHLLICYLYFARLFLSRSLFCVFYSLYL